VFILSVLSKLLVIRMWLYWPYSIRYNVHNLKKIPAWTQTDQLVIWKKHTTLFLQMMLRYLCITKWYTVHVYTTHLKSHILKSYLVYAKLFSVFNSKVMNSQNNYRENYLTTKTQFLLTVIITFSANFESNVFTFLYTIINSFS